MKKYLSLIVVPHDNANVRVAITEEQAGNTSEAVGVRKAAAAELVHFPTRLQCPLPCAKR